MTEADALAWLEKLEADGRAIHPASFMVRRPTEATAWLTEAETALRAVFPHNHSVLTSWRAIFERAKTYGRAAAGVPFFNDNFDQAVGVVHAAVGVVRDGHLRGLLDGARAETVGEVLEQAALLVGSHAVAAAVLAGGALETHLLHLCVRNGLTWPGDGSIEKYEGAVAQARNAGTADVYKATDSKLVKAWGGIRNDAAHKPTEFTRSAEDVRRMVDGVREFIARTA
jgi:hypothetical protein